MMNIKIACIVLLQLVSLVALAQLNIIPKPVEVKTSNSGSFNLNSSTAFSFNSKLKPSADFFNKYLNDFYGFSLNAKKGKSVISLAIDKGNYGGEGGYAMQVNNNGIKITAADEQGVFYGIQTLIQLLPAEKNSSLQIPYAEIKDKPRFAYRGMHLDVSRHFFPLEFVKKYVDFLALHKMNYFHWHLTDDQGWRIEIKKYPELTKAGAYRNGTIIGHHPGTGNDNIKYGGYYSQNEIKEVIKYAADRYITVVPEIELPGHGSAAIAAYNWLSCFPGEDTDLGKHPSEAGKQKKGKLVQETWGVFDDVFCAGNDSVFNFLQNVMDEVIALFPSKYIHVGGDECPKANWKRCPKCQQRMKEHGLKDEHELQSYFIQRMEKYINNKGRTIIGWDEILEGGLAPNAIVMSWRGEEGGIEAAKQNHQVIMTPGSHVYFDHAQAKPDDSLTIGGYTSVEKVYSYEPVPAKLPAEKHQYVLGAQANVWTEYMKYTTRIEYQVFPRMSALSEVLWSPAADRNWNNFRERLDTQIKRYNLWQVHYRKQD